MIGLDTNVLVRFLVQDDPQQSALANRVFSGLTRDEPGFISCVTLVELTWVLERAYRRPRREIATTIAEILASAEIVVENSETCRLALGAYVTAGEGQFADALIAVTAQVAGAQDTVTFDQTAAAAFGMRLLA